MKTIKQMKQTIQILKKGNQKGTKRKKGKQKKKKKKKTKNTKKMKSEGWHSWGILVNLPSLRHSCQFARKITSNGYHEDTILHPNPQLQTWLTRCEQMKYDTYRQNWSWICAATTAPSSRSSRKPTGTSQKPAGTSQPTHSNHDYHSIRSCLA